MCKIDQGRFRIGLGEFHFGHLLAETDSLVPQNITTEKIKTIIFVL